MRSKQTVAPTRLAVELKDVKDHLRIDGDDDNGTILACLYDAIDFAQNATGRQFINATYVTKYDAFPNVDKWVLPWQPISSITSIQYVDTDGDTQTWSSDNYTLEDNGVATFVRPNYEVSYPATRADFGAVTVTYVAGYGADSTAIPYGLRRLVLYKTAEYYEERSPVIVGTIVALLPDAIQNLIGQYQVPYIT